MKFKENFKRFFTLDRHHDAGFTLVELIVVIAILAILAGVAVPAYTGYIKKAEKAADLELLAAMNTAFGASCASANVAHADMVGAQFTMAASGDGMVVNGFKLPNGTAATVAVTMNEDLANKIYKMFKTLFDVNTNVFNVIVSITVTEDGLEGFTSEELNAAGGIFSNIFNGLKDDESVKVSIGAVQDSGFGSMGSQILMNKVGEVTGLVSGLMDRPAGQGLKETLSSDAALSNMAAYLGFKDDEDMTAEGAMTALDKFQAHIASKGENANAYYNNLLANYAVLEVAGTTSGKTSSAMLDDLKGGVNVDEIKNLLNSTDAGESTAAMGKAASMYAMYTAYANTLTGDAKTEAESHLASIGSFTSNLDTITAENSGFMNYLNNTDGKGQAEKDMAGYIGAMDIINQAKENDEEGAIGDLLEGGYTDPELLAALKGLLGN